MLTNPCSEILLKKYDMSYLMLFGSEVTYEWITRVFHIDKTIRTNRNVVEKIEKFFKEVDITGYNETIEYLTYVVKDL